MQVSLRKEVKMCGRIAMILVVLLFAAGCSQHVVWIKKNGDGAVERESIVHAVDADASKRYLTLAAVERGGVPWPVICSEPQPDAAVTKDSAFVAAATGKINDLLSDLEKQKNNEGSTSARSMVLDAKAALLRTVSEHLHVLTQRTGSLQFQREALFRLCELSINTQAMTPEERKTYLMEYQNTIKETASLASEVDEHLALISRLNSDSLLEKYLDYRKAQRELEKAREESAVANKRAEAANTVAEPIHDLAAALKQLEGATSSLAANIAKGALPGGVQDIVHQQGVLVVEQKNMVSILQELAKREDMQCWLKKPTCGRCLKQSQNRPCVTKK